jgi:hypothetical protein
MDTEVPLLRIGKFFFQGKYEDTVGTELLIPQDIPDKAEITVLGMTKRMIVFDQVTLIPNK